MGASTNQNTAGVQMVFDPVFRAIITSSMNIFLEDLSKQYPDDIILLCCDGAAWHKANALYVPESICLFFIPPYMPEMNPIEQIWKELRRMGFRNEVFATLEKVVNRLCDLCSYCSNHSQDYRSFLDFILF